MSPVQFLFFKKTLPYLSIHLLSHTHLPWLWHRNLHVVVHKTYP